MNNEYYEKKAAEQMAIWQAATDAGDIEAARVATTEYLNYMGAIKK